MRDSIKGHKASRPLIDQLVELYGNGYVTILGLKHPYEVHDIYTAIERIGNRQMVGKGFSYKGSLLKDKGIYHAHHSKGFYMSYNFLTYFRRTYRTDEDVVMGLKEMKDTFHIEDSKLVSAFVYKAFMDSIERNSRKTGQWIVFQRLNGIFNFICLYLHDPADTNDERLYSKIKDHLLLTGLGGEQHNKSLELSP